MVLSFKQIYRQLIVLITFLFVACHGSTQPEREDDITSQFWSISKTGEPVSYLVGSLHFGKEDSVLPPHIQKTVQEVDVVYSEVLFPKDPQHPTDPDYLHFLNKMFDQHSGKTLSDKIGKERFKKVKEFCLSIAKEKNIPVDINKLEKMEPWILPLYLQQLLIQKNFTNNKGVDQLIINQARQLNKEIKGLESHMFRYYILRDKPLYLIKNDIDQIVNNPLLAESSMRQMYYIYHSKTGLHAIDAAIHPENNPFSYVLLGQDGIASAQWLREKLLKKRNQHWMPVLLKELPQHKNLYVVGLLHLYGTAGLIHQLRKAGYTVTALTP